MTTWVTRLVARIPVTIHAKMLTAFLAIVVMLIIVGAVGLRTLSAVNRRAENLLDDYGVLHATPLNDQSSNRFLSNEIKGLRAFGVINPAIFLAT